MSRIHFCNRGNLPQPIQIQLSKKQKMYSHFFATFLKFTLNFKQYEKLFQNYRQEKAWLVKCLKR